MLATTLPSLFGAFGSLVAVLGLIWAGQALARRRLGPAGARRMGVVESVALDAKRRVHLVRCDGREVLLQTGGTTDLVIGWLPERTGP